MDEDKENTANANESLELETEFERKLNWESWMLLSEGE